MTPERVTITINSRAGPDAPIEVHDAVMHILDFFDLLSAAGGSEAGAISWRLVHVSMASPLRATAEAFPNIPGVPPEPIARREKIRLEESFRDITRGRVPEWMDKLARSKARTFFARNANGIGRTDIAFEEGKPLTQVFDKSAHVALWALNRLEQASPELDRSRIEFGSLEGYVSAVTSYYYRPAIKIRLHINSNDEVTCVFTDEMIDQIGHAHDWAEAWSAKRIVVSGEICYSKDGGIARVNARRIRAIDPRPLRFEDIADPNFTGGLSPKRYLDGLWEGDVE